MYDDTLRHKNGATKLYRQSFGGPTYKSNDQYNVGDIAALERSYGNGSTVHRGWTEENAGICRKRISLTSRMLKSSELMQDALPKEVKGRTPSILVSM